MNREVSVTLRLEICCAVLRSTQLGAVGAAAVVLAVVALKLKED